MRGQTRPAADEIGMRRKPLFYFSRWSLGVGHINFGLDWRPSLRCHSEQSEESLFPLRIGR
jgi:hypothetical protein